MKQFHHILFISTRLHGEKQALEQAIRLAVENEVTLDVLIICPPFPDIIAAHQEPYGHFLVGQANKQIEVAKSTLLTNHRNIKINIAIESGDTPENKIVQRVIRQGYDLVIKEAEENEKKPGFKALDMALLRKCPCALFIHRVSGHANPKPNVAVAIDSRNEAPAAHDLSLNLLRMSQVIAKHHKSDLHIVSCWDSAVEKYLYGHYLVSIPQKQINEVANRDNNTHCRALHEMIKKSNIDEKYNIHRLKGNPVDLIPSFIIENKIDILVMGTVARTGIAGFIIGNTAENILHKIDCSLLALKPPGFVSPVQAY